MLKQVIHRDFRKPSLLWYNMFKWAYTFRIAIHWWSSNWPSKNDRAGFEARNSAHAIPKWPVTDSSETENVICTNHRADVQCEQAIFLLLFIFRYISACLFSRISCCKGMHTDIGCMIEDSEQLAAINLNSQMLNHQCCRSTMTKLRICNSSLSEYKPD